MSKASATALDDSLARCANGDRSAFGEIVREHQSMVYSLALHFLRNPSMAEDLAQEVFLELYRDLKNIKSGAHLRFWLRKVTCHRSLDRVRRRQPGGILSLDDVPEPAATAREDDPLMQQKLWRLVNTLPPKPRMALILRYQEDLELQEVAEIMAMPVNTVKSSIGRALEFLRGKLARSTGGVKA